MIQRKKMNQPVKERGKKRNKKPRDKTLMTVEGSGTPSIGKKAKTEAPG